MRYPASEKLEIIRLVERSHLPVRRTLDKLGIPATTFYRWYDRYRAFGQAGLEDRTSGPGRVWNRILIAALRCECPKVGAGSVNGLLGGTPCGNGENWLRPPRRAMLDTGMSCGAPA